MKLTGLKKKKTKEAVTVNKKGTVRPVLSDHIKQDIFLAFQTGGCLLLHERSAESSCMSFLHYFHSAISNHLSVAISMSPECLAALNGFNCKMIVVNFGTP